MKITLPYLREHKRFECFSAEKLNEVLREGLTTSQQQPVYVEVCDDTHQCFVFLRDGQIYSAGAERNGQLVETSIKEFLLAAGRMSEPRAACYVLNNKILHSILILFQKKPALKLLSSLVDLDQVLDRIEDEGKSCIVSASQDEFLAILRYEKGEVKALCHELSAPIPLERSFRDDFLVKIYTLSAEKPLTILVYEDLLVKYAVDAKTVDRDYRGDVTELFLTKPPIVTLEFKEKEIGNWMLDKPVFKIGRTPDNDIAIDNLAVSRLHAVIEEDKGEFYVKDCDSLNGTIVNGNPVGRAILSAGDEIQIGKHILVFQKQSRREIALGAEPQRFDQTVIMRPGKFAPAPTPEPVEAPESEGDPTRPRLTEKAKTGEREFEIGESSLTLGKDETADIEVDGFFVAKKHAEISRENGNYIIRHVAGHRKVKVGGRPIKEWVLRNNDHIQIGKKEFVFHE